MQQSNPLVSINILTYNAEKYIKQCLNSVLNQTYKNFEILIIDNYSKDSTIDYLKSLEDRKNLRIIFNPKNLGFSAGHNLGIRESKGEFILCLNQDVFLKNNFIEKAIKIFKKDGKFAAVQGKLLRWNTGRHFSRNEPHSVSYIIDTTGFIIFKNRRIINRYQGEIDGKKFDFDKEGEIFGVDGAAPIYRRKALEDVKIELSCLRSNKASAGHQNYNQIRNEEYFDEDFFAYKEDVDLAWRLQLYGWKSFYQPEAVAWHDRTAGDSAAINWIGIIRERIKIGKFAKYLAFKNQRLMQIKNEQIGLLMKHLPWFLPKEIASWIFVLIFERYAWRAIKDLFKQMPMAWKKRKIIMNRKKADIKKMKRWFT